MRNLHKNGTQAASSEVVRNINRRIVLNLIRTRQPVSRADLARVSGMQPSTISLIVEQLIQENWVLEREMGRPPRGRRPTFLRLNDERVIIGVDIRPSETTVALADANGKFTAREIVVTTRDPELTFGPLIECLGRMISLCKGRKIEGIGVSVPGRFDSSSDRLMFAPNLGWRDVAIGSRIGEATGLDVELENAANACALATVWFDNGSPSRNLVAVTVSEGIGTGILSNGQLVRGSNGMGGEFGHVQLDPKGPECGCGSRGCWESFASNRAALRYYENGSSSTARSFVDLLSLAEQGETRACQALEKMAHYLGKGMRIIVAGLAPEQNIIVGELTRAWKRFGPLIEAEVKAQMLPGGVPPELIPAHEGGMARLRGTIALVLQKDFGSCLQPDRPEY
ncbi:MAG: ROK family protein [Bryobacteraceae bacterium]